MRILIFCLLILVLSDLGFAQSPPIQKLWESEKLLRVPESVLFDKQNNILFVSNVDGKPLDKDGAGFISRVSPEGKIVELEWIKGLNAPKGMGIHNGMLYVTDIDEVVSIDIKKGAIVLRTPIEDSRYLNDIAVSEEGHIFVSDMGTGRIHRLDAGKVSLFAADLEGVNGLAFIGSELWALAKGNLWQIKSAGEKHKVASGMEESSDGLVITADKSFYATSWAGVIYQIFPKGKVQQLVDMRPQNLNTADLGIDQVKRHIYIPTFFGNTNIAYRY